MNDLDDALDKIDALESELDTLIQAIAVRSHFDGPAMDELFQLTAMNYPRAWKDLGGHPHWPLTIKEPT